MPCFLILFFKVMFKNPETIQKIMLVGKSDAVKDANLLIERAAPSYTSLCIVGEHGTGRDTVARLIHHKSKMKDQKFCRINCDNIPVSWLEDTLYDEKRKTFYFHEIGDLGLMQQSILVNYLMELEFSTRNYARVISSSGKGIEHEITEGRIIKELGHVLAVVPILIPPLRKRKEDLKLIAQNYLTFIYKNTNRQLYLREDAYQLILGKEWPGNERQLYNVLQHASMTGGNTIDSLRLEESYRFIEKQFTSEKGKKDREDVMSLPLDKLALDTLAGYRQETEPMILSEEQGTEMSDDSARILTDFLTTATFEEIKSVVYSDRIRRYKHDKDAAASLGVSARSMSYQRRKIGLGPLREYKKKIKGR